MTKKELLKQIKAQQKTLAQQLENDDRALNPNHKKGRRSLSQMFNNVNTKDKMF